MFDDRSPITALMAALVLLAAVGPTVAAQSAGTHASVDATSTDLQTDASNAESVRVNVYRHDGQLVVDARYEGDGTALVTVEALDGTYAGEGTYEISGDEQVALAYPDDSTTLEVTVETENYEGSFLVDFDREVLTCSDEEITVLRPIVVEGSTSVDATSSLTDTAVESETVLQANTSYPDLPVECEATANASVQAGQDDDSTTTTSSADEDETTTTTQESSDDSDDHESAQSGVEVASHFAAQVYADVTNFGHSFVADLRGDGEAVSDAARAHANDTGEQISENVSADANASASAEGDAAADENGASANGQADANADASADAGSTHAEAGFVGQIRALIGVVVG